MNAFLDNFLKRTLWLWLPFYALVRLTKEILNTVNNDKK